jgi:hypothetical protein
MMIYSGKKELAFEYEDKQSAIISPILALYLFVKGS